MPKFKRRALFAFAALFLALTTALASSSPAQEEAAARPIKVGLIRCDSHGVYYAALMARHDPLKLRDPLAGTKAVVRYTWQRGGTHEAFYQNYADPADMTVPGVEGFEITKVWDEYRDAAEMAAGLFEKKPIVCDSFEDVSDGVDLVFIADTNFEGDDHLKLAAPGLRKGVPTFVDKPLASTYADAKAILDLAREHKAPLLCLSMLRVLPAARFFKNRFAEIAPVRFGVVRGLGNNLAAQIHGLSLAQLLFGPGVKKVEVMGPTRLAYIRLDYGNQPDRPESGVMILNAAGRTSVDSMFYAAAYSEKGGLHSPAFDWYSYPWGGVEVVKAIKDMVRTGKSPVPDEEMLELIAIAEAARLSQKEKRPVDLEEIAAQKR